MGHYADQFQGKTSAVGQTFFLNTGSSGNFTRKFPFTHLKMLANNFRVSALLGPLVAIDRNSPPTSLSYNGKAVKWHLSWISSSPL